nr:YfhO family protein [Bacteroidales bacterium]
IQWVDTPNEEIDAIASTDLLHTAIMNKEFEQLAGNYSLADSDKGQIELTEYKPNKLTYKYNAICDQLVVFSEIWTSKGWKMTVDGQEHPLLRANYLLRCALIPSGEHEIVMEYKPKAYSICNRVVFISSLIMVLGLVAALVFTFKPKKENKA